MSPLQELLKSHAPWLFDEFGLNVVADSYDPSAFGNSTVVLESNDIRLRLVQDRGQVFAEFEPPTESSKWWDLSFILEAISGAVPQPTFELDGVLSLLRQNLGRIVEALGPQWTRTRQDLEQRQQDRFQALRASSINRSGK